MGWKPLIFYGHRILLGLLPECFDRLLKTLCEHLPDALGLPDLLHKGNNGLCISPFQFKTVGLLFIDDAVFKTLDSEPTESSTANGVEAVPVAEVVDLDQRLEILVEEVRSKHGKRLVLDLVDEGFRLIGPLVELQMPAATDGTATTGVTLDLILEDLFCIKALRIFDLLYRRRPVLHRGVADVQTTLIEKGGPFLGKLFCQAILKDGKVLFFQFLHLFRLGNGDWGISLHHHGFQLFRPHDSAQAGSSGEPPLVGRYAGDGRHLFTRRPDTRHFAIFTVNLF